MRAGAFRLNRTQHASSFSELDVRKCSGTIDGRQLWQLVKPLDFFLAVNGGGIRVSVPAGFQTDFASVPRALWPIFPPQGPWCEAAVVHDYLYGSCRCSRFLADSLFREAMYRLGVPVWRRVAAYYAVRWFGRRHKA